MITVCVAEPCQVHRRIFLRWLHSSQFTWLDQEDVIFMSLCTVVFSIQKMAFVATLEFGCEGLHVDMHDALLGGGGSNIASWPQQTFWNMSECRISVFMWNWMHERGHSRPIKKIKKGTYYACCASQLFITHCTVCLMKSSGDIHVSYVLIRWICMQNIPASSEGLFRLDLETWWSSFKRSTPSRWSTVAVRSTDALSYRQHASGKRGVSQVSDCLEKLASLFSD